MTAMGVPYSRAILAARGVVMMRLFFACYSFVRVFLTQNRCPLLLNTRLSLFYFFT
jgi:hypothetical protein